MSEALVELEQSDRVVTIRLNRPRKNNVVDFAVLERFEQVIEEVAEMNDLAAIVVTGSGDHAFCGGLDSSVILEREEAAFGILLRRFWYACWRLAHLPPPVIAAINGYCYAGGVVLACSSDLRIAVEGATFTIPGSEYGMAVGTHQLPFLAAECWSKEVILLARPVDAAALYHAGLLNRVVPPQDLWPTVEGFLSRLRELSPTALRNNKALLNRALETGPAAALEAELANDLHFVDNSYFRGRITASVAAYRASRAAAKAQPS